MKEWGWGRWGVGVREGEGVVLTRLVTPDVIPPFAFDLDEGVGVGQVGGGGERG